MADYDPNSLPSLISLAQSRISAFQQQNPKSDIEAMKRVGRQIRYGTVLSTWMLAYAEWRTLECLEFPSVTQRARMARTLAHAPVNSGQVRELEARLDFKAYVNELAKGPMERARAKFVAAFPDYIDAHRLALSSASSAGDYRAMAQIAEPVLDRVYPKKSELAQATQVNITLTPEQIRGVSAYAAPLMVVEEPTPALPDADA